MKIIKLHAENVKRLRAVEITPDGALVQITGANGSGKSSVLDAIYFALAGKKAIDAVPVRQGEESALIELDLGRIKVTRRFEAGGNTSLVVEAEDGARYSSPQTLLDSLLGSLTFDPLEFTRMDAGTRSNALRRLVNLDVDFAQLDRESALDFNARTSVNRQAKELAAQEKALRASIAESIPELIDVTGLLEQMKRAGEQNTVFEMQSALVVRLQHDAGAAIACVEAARLALEEAEKEERRVTALLDKERGAFARMHRVDVDELRLRVTEAQEQNRVVESSLRTKEAWKRAEEQLANLEEQSQALTDAIDARNQRKREAISAAAMPIESLTFGGDLAVLYNGLPFEQASSAEQLRVSVAIAMAMNPKLRVLRIKDGSLLDETNLAAIAAMAEAGDYQIWVERVETSGKVGVVMEDGAVRELVPA